MYVPSRYGKKSLTILTGNRKKVETNENYSIDEDAKEILQEKKQEDAGYRSKTNGSVLKLGGCN